MKDIKILKIERCKIDHFEPKELMEDLKHISLQGNKIRDLKGIKFNEEVPNFKLKGVELLSLDLSGNLFTEFPYKALDSSE
jgi:Leucine-rich repeat (LRR) protein